MGDCYNCDGSGYVDGVVGTRICPECRPKPSPVTDRDAARALVAELAKELHECCYEHRYVPDRVPELIARARAFLGGGS